MYNGIINVYKEAGYTSHDVVAKLRGILGQKKIGHTGTLDPEAVGVLPVCLGSGTKLADMLTEKSKVYRAQVLLGTVTDTEDITGCVMQVNVVPANVPERLFDTVRSFTGGYEQIPPMYSAIKKNGKRLYELAREGKAVERAPRRVDIYSIEIDNVRLPRFTMTVHCGKGTYIRALCRDIGEKLGCGACMESLCRIRSGQFCLETAMTLEQIRQRKEKGTFSDFVLSVDSMFSEFPAVEIAEEHGRLLQNGNKIPVHIAAPDGSRGQVYTGRVRMYCKGVFYGVYERKSGGEEYFPVKMFMP